MEVSTECETLIDGNFGNAWEHLRYCGLYNCGGLVSALDCGACKRLIDLWLSGSTITELPDSIGLMKCLSYLSISCERLQCLPKSIGDLQNLWCLHLMGCESLKRLPNTLGACTNLMILSFERCGIKKLPGSLGQLSRLFKLSIEGCKNLQRLPASIIQLNRLKQFGLEDCGSIEAIGALTTLQGLPLWGSTSITKLPPALGIVSSLHVCGYHHARGCNICKGFVGRGQRLEEGKRGFLRAYKDERSGQTRLRHRRVKKEEE